MEVVLLLQVCFALLALINELWLHHFRILHFPSLCHTLGVRPVRNHQAVIARLALNNCAHVFTELR